MPFVVIRKILPAVARDCVNKRKNSRMGPPSSTAGSPMNLTLRWAVWSNVDWEKAAKESENRLDLRILILWMARFPVNTAVRWSRKIAHTSRSDGKPSDGTPLQGRKNVLYNVFHRICIARSLTLVLQLSGYWQLQVAYPPLQKGHHLNSQRDLQHPNCSSHCSERGQNSHQHYCHVYCIILFLHHL